MNHEVQKILSITKDIKRRMREKYILAKDKLDECEPEVRQKILIALNETNGMTYEGLVNKIDDLGKELADSDI